MEQEAIAFRRASGVKLPDAIIAATARVYSLSLLTIDQQLHTKFTAYMTDE
jgi:predicted nucleic acid-binding protein